MGQAAEDEMEREEIAAEAAREELAAHRAGTCRKDPAWYAYCAAEQGWFDHEY